jgi:hypothetical protein
MRIDVNKLIAATSVVLAEVEEGGTAEAGFEAPFAPGPGLAVVIRPTEL